MITMLNAFTEEVDDMEAAVSEILEQLDVDHRLLAHSLGILHCYSEFCENGIVKALCEKLPFDVVGSTTSSLSASGRMSEMGLALTVLTSDTVQFKSGVSEEVKDSAEAPVTELYKRLIDPLPRKPALLLPFIPFLMIPGGDEFVAQIDALSGGIPAFGTLSISNEIDFSRCYTIYNGEYYPAALVLTALIGDVEPIFMNTSINEESILKQKAVITEVNRNRVQTINNIKAAAYMESIGLAKDGKISGMESTPFVVDLEDGSRLVRANIGSNEQGEMILCGAVPVNSPVAFASQGFNDVVETASEKAAEAAKAAQGRGILMYSCAARYWVLGLQIRAELEAVEACIAGTAPYHLVCSGGEISPQFLSNGKVANHLQNNSLIICIL
ncbi:MAG: FIST C-terminal domain-containing protein [Spirochaetaceae bacterium]|nr:FIST C-terminal domain-containing protein [Spirochaetaceae bacterium]